MEIWPWIGYWWPEKSPLTNFYQNPNILRFCFTMWVRHFEFFKSNPRFVISDPKILMVPIFIQIRESILNNMWISFFKNYLNQRPIRWGGMPTRFFIKKEIRNIEFKIEKRWVSVSLHAFAAYFATKNVFYSQTN